MMEDRRAEAAERPHFSIPYPQLSPARSTSIFIWYRDASGETLTTMAKAAIVQLSGAKPNRHMHPLGA